MNKLTQRKDIQFSLKLLGVSFILFLIYFAFIARPAVAFIKGQIQLQNYSADASGIDSVTADTVMLCIWENGIPVKFKITGSNRPRYFISEYYICPLNGHCCEWKYCPYKRLQPYQYKDAVLDYTGEPEDSEPVQIDLLHLLTPDASYDELMEMVEED